MMEKPRAEKKRTREAGILMPVFSLPSKYGIGTLGRAAYRFADFLKASGQSLWQVLPLGPTGYGDSPYASFSSFAGNPYYIDIELLIEDGLLTAEEADSFDFGADERRVDYGKLFENRFRLLKLAYDRGSVRDAEKIRVFTEENASWLEPYACFMALKKANGMKAWNRWTVNETDARTEEDARFYAYLQYLFFEQWEKLKAYVNGLGIRIIGDVPIYVAYDSADCWSEPEQFRLTENNEPAFVSGVPPDYFSKDGQLWGNPLYDYDRMRKEGFNWWIRRIGGAARMYDAIRIDHFRGFASYYSIPAGEKTARNGHWEPGPGMDLVGILTSWFSDTEFIAEDLGTLTEDVRELLEASGLAGMSVLEFAFDPSGESSYLPHAQKEHSVCYTGTHDNAPLMDWIRKNRKEAVFAKTYLGLGKNADLSEALIRCAYMGPAEKTVIPVQDWLGLGKEARVNTPGLPDGNWQWRMEGEALTAELEERIRTFAKRYGRMEQEQKNTAAL